MAEQLLGKYTMVNHLTYVNLDTVNHEEYDNQLPKQDIASACLYLLRDTSTTTAQKRQRVDDYIKLLSVRQCMAKAPQAADQDAQGTTLGQVSIKAGQVSIVASVVRDQEKTICMDNARLLEEKVEMDRKIGKRKLDDSLDTAREDMAKRYKQHKEWLEEVEHIDRVKSELRMGKQLLRKWYDASAEKGEVEMPELCAFWDLCFANDKVQAQQMVMTYVIGLLSETVKFMETVGGAEEWVARAAQVHEEVGVDDM